MCFQKRIRRNGRPIEIPKFTIGAVALGPNQKFRIGNKSSVPPPPEIVETTKHAVPIKKRKM